MCDVERKPFGKIDDKEIVAYELKSKNVRATILNYGGIIQSLQCPDKNGIWDDITTGFDTMEEYKEKSRFFGCLVGRYANRIGGGKFSLNGKVFSLFKNNGGSAPNCRHSLHGGRLGFDKYLWESKVITNGIELTIMSPDGDEGYPGNLQVTVQYTLVDDALTISYSATTDADTVVNLTNHAYFNLDGHASWGTLDNHTITLSAPDYTPVDDDAIPTGEIKSVQGTTFDLQKGMQLTQTNLASVDGGNGYDHNWCVKGNNDGKKVHMATVTSSLSGRKMVVEATNPGIQFYTANFLTGQTGKKGASYGRQTAYCLETQHYPDTPNHANFPQATVKAGETYKQFTTFTLSTQ